jgi:hypothetical protein
VLNQLTKDQWVQQHWNDIVKRKTLGKKATNWHLNDSLILQHPVPAGSLQIPL